MSQVKDILTAVLDTISTNRELIQETYAQGYLTRTGENNRAILKLHQHRIIVSDGHDRFRLSRHLTKFLDEATQKQHLYEQFGNMQELIKRINDLMSEYSLSITEAKTEYSDNIAGQFHEACADLADAISSGISKLLDQAENNFAAVSTIAAKQRQNLHYISEAEKISNTLRTLALLNIESALKSGSVYYEELEPSYRTLIFERMSEWDSELVQVTAILRAFLFKLRIIEPDVKRIRQFAIFIRQNPDYTPPDIDKSQMPPWLMRDPGLEVKAFPNLLDESTYDELAAIARSLPAPKVSPRQKKGCGTLERTSQGRETIKMVVSPCLSSLYTFGLAASKSDDPLSALKWKREQCKDLDISEELWLLLVMHSQDIARWPYNRLIYRRLEHRGPSAISKNLYIQDVLVHGR